MRFYLAFLLPLLFVACRTQEVDTEYSRWEQHAAQTTIIRDDFGVPHVYGKTDADAVFGLLYAQCEDDFKRVERNFTWATGRLAEEQGEKALYSDLRAQLFMTKEEAINNYEKCPAWLQQLCQAWADGINYYLHTHPEVKPSVITHYEPWMTMYFTEGSIGGDIERISTRRIKAFYEEDKSLSLTEYGDGLWHRDPDDEPRGSNGVAIGGALTESGAAMLLINPHTSFYFRGEVHMVSEEGLNAYGAVTWGQFFVYQGFNEKTGWMHTSTYVDIVDEFKETMVEQDGKLFYEYGDELRPVETQEVTLKYLEGDTLKEKTFPIYRTHHGPITHKIDDQWVATALMWEPVDALTQSYIRTKQDGFKSFREMMNMRTNSSNNTVYADAGGNIAYFHGNFIPKRDTQFNYRRPLDGSNPATDWQGLHTVDECIVIHNPETDWIQNCNSSPFTAAAEFSPKEEDYPDYMAPDPENFRAVHAIKLLKNHPGGLTLDGLIDIGYDPFLPAFEAFVPGLIEAYDQAANKDPNLAEPIEELRNWDFTASKESVALTLAHYYGWVYSEKGPKIRGRNIVDELINFGTKSEHKDRIALFTEAVKRLEDDFGNWKTPWGEINRYQRLSGDIALEYDDSKPSIPVDFVSGRWGPLASYGTRKGKNTKRRYGYAGNSFVAVVEFGDKLKAKTMLAGGQSSDPNSPHFDDQAQRYADIEFKDVAFYREDVEARAKSTYHPGERN